MEIVLAGGLGSEASQSLSGRTAGELAGDVEVAEVAGILLEQMEQDPLERGRGAVAWPPVTGPASLAEVMRLDDGPGAGGLRTQRSSQPFETLAGGDMPVAVAIVAPGFGDIAALEAPLQPAQLDVGAMVEQFGRCPARRHPAAALLTSGQGTYLAHQPRAKEIQVLQEHLAA